MFVSLHGTFLKYCELPQTLAILLFMTITMRVANPLIKETGWIEGWINLGMSTTVNPTGS